MMRRFKYLKSVLVSGVVLTAACSPTSAQMMKEEGRATFNAQGETTIPEGFRLWPFIGAPLTPNGLNGGEAGFPEFHHVYIDPKSFAEYRKTGKFPEGTTIVKELVLLQKGDYEDGSKDAPSGRGFFAFSFNGIDMMVKDTKRFSETQGWGFFNFGHHAPPYAKKAAAAPADACAACHEANADEDMVFKSMYPILNQKK
ncbi:chain A cytochrome P460 [Sneathiella sp. P13V-1]|uniref:cytochrome P460 family protein n=1 Tax=Sneathiella sp. P13V-1 TaxID=2697366 RepID=UPI00187B2547|nr:cytochrome P460 family protein [Sneathiella sp. P13V-1]MBE7637879.1 chain A cytochrome P460 [Sneathiella sp. P13V-1]